MPLFNGKNNHPDKPNTKALEERLDTLDNKHSSAPTELVDNPPSIEYFQRSPIPQNNHSVKEGVTVLVRPNSEEEINKKIGMDDPVVGWLVVIDGPGKGCSVPLGYGQNSIGRGQAERVSLDFGSEKDSGISRSKHAQISYDHKGNKYYLHSGDSVNLTYLNNQPLLVPTELQGGEDIVLGETTLRFIPFCGENFTWQQNND